MSPALTPEVVAEARRLVEAGWTQGHLARDDVGKMVNPLNKRAVCFCVLGALIRASNGYVDAFAAVEQAGIPTGGAIARSDHSQASALAVLDELAARISPAEGARP